MTDLQRHLELRGVSRRDFVAFCGALAVSMGLGELAGPRVAEALERGAVLKPAVWVNLGSCSGCTESLAQSDHPDVATIVLEMLSLDYVETLSAAAGRQTEDALDATLRRGGHVAIVEGAVMTGEGGNTLRIAGKPGTELLDRVCRDASLVIAVGACAVDGGWVAASPDPAGAQGVLAHAPALRDKLVNVPGCPANPEWIVAVLVDHLLLGRKPSLDASLRPTAIFGATIHDNCPRRGHYEAGQFVERFGGLEEQLGWCLYKVGCKGPTTASDCPSVRWNRRASWCVESGSPCIGCCSPRWVDANAPFLVRTSAVTPGIGGMKPENIAQIVAAGAAGAFAVWGVVETARGRLREDETAAEADADAPREAGTDTPDERDAE